MNINTLEEKIRIRANEVVQGKIAKFKKSIDDALTELFGTTGMGDEQFGQLEYFEGSTRKQHACGRARLEGLKLAICDYKKPYDQHRDTKVKLPWPSELWESERERIRNELLEKMDLMQRLLVATERRSDSDVPEDAKVTT